MIYTTNINTKLFHIPYSVAIYISMIKWKYDPNKKIQQTDGFVMGLRIEWNGVKWPYEINNQHG